MSPKISLPKRVSSPIVLCAAIFAKMNTHTQRAIVTGRAMPTPNAEWQAHGGPAGADVSQLIYLPFMELTGSRISGRACWKIGD